MKSIVLIPMRKIVLVILLVLFSGFTFGQTDRQALDEKCVSVQELSDKLLLKFVEVLKGAEITNNAEDMNHGLAFVKGQKAILVSARNSVCSASTLKAANATWTTAMAKMKRATEEEAAYINKHLADLYRERSASEK